MKKVGSLFSGIGGFDLGLERAGFEIKWQVEIDEYCRHVLAKHWPTVQRYGDITAMDWTTVQPVDLLCGGFPCQDLSFAGKRAGIDGARSGLWSEYVRAIRALRPRYVLVENVPGILTNAYMGRVLGDLAESGYDAEWDCIPASAVGAPHRRDRVWLMAYRDVQRMEKRRVFTANASISPDTSELFSNGSELHREHSEREIPQPGNSSGEARILAHSFLQQRHRWSDGVSWWEREPQETLQTLGIRGRQEDGLSIPESLLGRVAHGIPHRVDRLRGLGNAIVPQIAEALGRMILEADKCRSRNE